MREDERQEKDSEKVVDYTRILELMLLGGLIGEIVAVLEGKYSREIALKNIRNNIKKEVGNVLPSLLESVDEVFDKNIEDTLSDYVVDVDLDERKMALRNRFKDYIRTDGRNFVVGAKTGLPQYFATFVEKEIADVVSGETTVARAVEKAINELSKVGLKVIDYDSGITRNIDVWARQEMIFAQKESSQDIRNTFAKANDITIWEFDAHANARESHKVWQGKRYDTTGRYYVTLDKLTHGEEKDYGCRHRAYPVWNIQDDYMFTDKELKSLDTKPFVFRGREYNGYEATQRQRAYERSIRAMKRERNMREDAGLDITKITKRLNRENREYSDFCKAMGTYRRSDRTKVLRNNK